MKRSYTKVGVSRRLEHDSGNAVQIELSERGEAIELDGGFSAHSTAPFSGATLETEPFERAERLLRRIRETSEDAVERVVLGWGSARHQLSEGADSEVWTTSEARLSIDMRDGSSLYLGAESLDQVSLGPVRRAQEEPSGEIAAGRVVLRPEGTAFLTRAVIEASGGFVVQGEMPLSIDGDGRAVAACRPRSADPHWPNRFRPSYRRPPVHLPFNAEVATERHAPSTSAGSVTVFAAEVIAARVSMSMRGADGFCRVRGTPGQWAGSLTRIGGETEWFPLLAGVVGFSAELELDQLEVERADIGIV